MIQYITLHSPHFWPTVMGTLRRVQLPLHSALDYLESTSGANQALGAWGEPECIPSWSTQAAAEQLKHLGSGCQGRKPPGERWGTEWSFNLRPVGTSQIANNLIIHLHLINHIQNTQKPSFLPRLLILNVLLFYRQKNGKDIFSNAFLCVVICDCIHWPALCIECVCVYLGISLAKSVYDYSLSKNLTEHYQHE